MSRLPGLATATITFVFLSALLAGALGYATLNERVTAYQESALAVAVETRVRGAQVAFSSALHREWEGLKAVAQKLDPDKPTELDQALSLVVGSGSLISWAGYAGIDGVVRTASNGLLLNASVASRPWYQQGLKGDFAGDVHEAVLLASLLPPQGTEPRRFLDLASPIRSANGSVAGVLGYHLNYKWAQRLLKEMATSLDVDLFLVNVNGDAVIATDGGIYHSPDLASFRTARTGASAVNVETWPDGRPYFTAVLPELDYQDLPRFGWSMIARIDASKLAEPNRQFSTGLLWNLALFGLLLILMSAVFVVVFIRPFGQLADNAARIAAGDDVYPFESRRTRELNMIASSIAKLQAKVALSPTKSGQTRRE
ncbi:cache domain-containing protein [Rhizobium populisoli]|uniref:cache domain-containing protein n=1 Tax=Rhizobium populisoli TaxID=2859785 RepID=UPI001FE548D9|nr:cache domain-containing protein [Rhizobium populisoli]